eukprot:6253282-Prymnesium_polylepis.1
MPRAPRRTQSRPHGRRRSALTRDRSEREMNFYSMLHAPKRSSTRQRSRECEGEGRDLQCTWGAAPQAAGDVKP